MKPLYRTPSEVKAKAWSWQAFLAEFMLLLGLGIALTFGVAYAQDLAGRMAPPEATTRGDMAIGLLLAVGGVSLWGAVKDWKVWPLVVASASVGYLMVQPVGLPLGTFASFATIYVVRGVRYLLAYFLPTKTLTNSSPKDGE